MYSKNVTLPPDVPNKLVRLLDQWQAIACDRLPMPSDFPFSTLVKDNPGLAVVEPVVKCGSILDFKYVLVGPEHVTRTGRRLAGELFSDILYRDAAKRVIATYNKVLDTGTPQYWEFINSLYGSPPVEYGRLLLPLYDDAGNGTALIGNWIWKDD